MSTASSSLNRFHVFVLVAWQFTILFATQMLFGIFTTYTPRWRCNNMGGDDVEKGRTNGTTWTVVVDEQPFGKDCAAYTECPAGLVEFEPSPFASAAVDFDWICGSGAYYKALYSQIQFAGVLVGTLVIAPLSDKFGRKPVGLLVLSLGLVVLAASALSPNGLALLAARFAVSFLMGGTLVVIATFTMEIIPPQHRMILRTFCNWGISRLFLTFLCYLFPDWRSASIACALCSLPAILILAFITPESPTWLHSQGKLEKMRASERQIARFAGQPYSPVAHASLGAKSQGFFDLVRNRTLFGRLLVLWMMWFCSSFSSYSIDLNSSNISGDLFLNQLLLSCPVIVSKMILFLLDSNWPAFSRRILHQCSQCVVCLCFLLLTLLIVFRYDGVLVVLALNQVGNSFIQYGWDACYLCALEGMPTPVRSSSLGSCSLIAQFGAMLAPVMVFLNDSWAASVYVAVAVLGSLNFLVSYVWLIDTKGVDLDAVKLGVEGDEKVEEGMEEDGCDGEKAKETGKFLMPSNGKKCEDL